MSNAAWLVKFIRDQAGAARSSSVHLAVVTSLQPFRVKMEGVELGSPFLMVEPGLLSNTKTYDATLTADTTLTGTLTMTPADPGPLQEGDTVVVVPVGDKFAVLAKVVAV
jgi:hypothetical protein